MPTPPTFIQDQFALIRKGVIKQGCGFRSAESPGLDWFLLKPIPSPQKDGGQQPVINLKTLNEFFQTQYFKMEGIHTLKELVRPGDWFAKLDLKDAYFTIPIHQNHRKFLRFLFLEKTYEFKQLVGLAKDLWMWCLERNIHITAQHPPTQDVLEYTVSWNRTDTKD